MCMTTTKQQTHTTKTHENSGANFFSFFFVSPHHSSSLNLNNIDRLSNTHTHTRTQFHCTQINFYFSNFFLCFFIFFSSNSNSVLTHHHHRTKTWHIPIFLLHFIYECFIFTNLFSFIIFHIPFFFFC